MFSYPCHWCVLNSAGPPDNELFKRTKVEVVGVSADPVDKQKAFVDKQKLTVRA